MFKKGYSLYSAFYTQLAFYSQSAVCILPPVRSLQSAFYTDRFMFPPLFVCITAYFTHLTLRQNPPGN